MTKTRSLIVATLATLLLTAGLAQAAKPPGRVAQTRAQIAAELNRQGVFNPAASSAPWKGSQVRIRTTASSTTNIIQNNSRSVLWNVPSARTRAGALEGTAESQTLGLGGSPTIVSGVVVTSTPWRQPAPNE